VVWDYELSDSGVMSRVDEEALSDSLAEEVSEPIEMVSGEMNTFIPLYEDTLEQPEQTEIVTTEQTDKVSFEKVENLLTVLSEYIQATEPEIAAAAYELLDVIDGVVDKAVIEDGEAAFTEAETQEKLTELFVELFDSLGIEYTSEEIESMAKFAVQTRLLDEIEDQRNEEEFDGVLKDIGTHETIKDLLRGINTIQKVKAYAGAIGKSALRLYSNTILVEKYLTR
jgi:hypothetical protein